MSSINWKWIGLDQNWHFNGCACQETHWLLELAALEVRCIGMPHDASAIARQMLRWIWPSQRRIDLYIAAVMRRLLNAAMPGMWDAHWGEWWRVIIWFWWELNSLGRCNMDIEHAVPTQKGQNKWPLPLAGHPYTSRPNWTQRLYPNNREKINYPCTIFKLRL